MATHFSILAWEISSKEEAGGVQSMRLQKSQTRLSNYRNDCVYLKCTAWQSDTFTFCHMVAIIVLASTFSASQNYHKYPSTAE